MDDPPLAWFFLLFGHSPKQLSKLSFPCLLILTSWQAVNCAGGDVSRVVEPLVVYTSYLESSGAKPPAAPPSAPPASSSSSSPSSPSSSLQRAIASLNSSSSSSSGTPSTHPKRITSTAPALPGGMPYLERDPTATSEPWTIEMHKALRPTPLTFNVLFEGQTYQLRVMMSSVVSPFDIAEAARYAEVRCAG